MNDRFLDALHEEFTSQIPLLLVYLAALAMAAALWSAHRGVCTLVLLAFLLKLATQFAATYLMVAAQHHWRNAVAAWGGAPVLFSAQCAAYLLHGVADAVLLLAVFKGRELPAAPRREPPPDPGDTEPPPLAPPPPPDTGIQTRRW